VAFVGVMVAGGALGCFFIPIIDSAIRARAAGERARTRAIVIYPMNALANSQLKELEKFIDQSGLPDRLRPTFARYTGQESQEERERIRAKKPDILLTNFMMLELLMTRQNPLDRAVISNSEGLEFLVLDELRDAAFDKGLISFDDDGVVLLGPTLSAAAQKSLAIDSVPRLEGLRDEHGANLSKHRSRHGFS
jgi:hypothetical protein